MTTVIDLIKTNAAHAHLLADDDRKNLLMVASKRLEHPQTLINLLPHTPAHTPPLCAG